MKNVLIYALIILAGLVVAFYYADQPVEKLIPKYTNAASQFMEIDGMNVHYRIEGDGKMPLVLLHGTSASLHTWDGWVEVLSDEFTIVRMDLPAFGLTGPAADGAYSLENYVDFLEKFTEALKLDTFYLAGNSLGGAIAWNYALVNPDQVKKLILIDASGFPKAAGKRPFIFRIAQNPFFAAILKNFTPSFLVENNLKAVYFDQKKVTPQLVTRYHDLLLREGNRLAFIQRSKVLGKSRISEIATIDIPTLIQWGKHDAWIPVEDGYRFAEEMPNAQLIVYDNAGHVPMEEIPLETAQDARTFLQKHP